MTKTHPIRPIEIGSRVLIRGAEEPGIVSAVMHSQDGVLYRIVYWYGGMRREDWMYAFELSL